MAKKTAAEIEEDNTLSQERLQKLLEAGCSVPEAAGFFFMTADQLTHHCQEEYNIDLRNYSQLCHNRGKALIREKQYKKSLSKGDNPLLIWLGKARLGQKDKVSDSMDAPADVIEFLNTLREEDEEPDPMPEL